MAQSLSSSVNTVTSTDDYHDKRLRIYYNSSAGVSDDNNDFDVSGDWPNRSNVDVDISLPYGGGQQLIYDETKRFYKNTSGSYDVDYSASLTGIAYWGSGQVITTSGDSNVPRKEYDTPSKPAAPTVDLSLWLSSDAYTTINWTDPSSWGGAPSGNQRFDVQISTTSSFSNIIKPWANITANTAWTRAPGSPNTTYYARVRANTSSAGNGGGASTWSNTRTFTTPIETPGNVSGLSVYNIQTNQATFSWNAPSDWGGDNDGTYRLEVHGNSSYTDLIGTTSGTGRSGRFIDGLDAGTQYWWRVRAYNSGGSGSYVNGPSFSTPGLPNPPRNLSVFNPGPIDAAFIWQAPSSWNGGVGDYQVYLEKVSDGSSDSLTTTNLGVTWPYTLEPNETYEVRVRAVNTFGPSPWEGPISFTTSAPPVFVKKSGTWRSTTAVYVKKSGAWRQVIRVWVKKSGVWR